jgi:hypothetical protein
MHARMHAVKHARVSMYALSMARLASRTGPRGGRTTLTVGGLLKKTVYLDAEEWEVLRRRSFEEHRPISEILRELIRGGLGLDKE